MRRFQGEKNKEALVRYVLALVSAYRFMRDPVVRNEVVRMILESEVIARQPCRSISSPRTALSLSPARSTSQASARLSKS